MSYQIYSDESGHERFRSVGALSGKKTNIDKLRTELKTVLKDRSKECIEFKKIDGDIEKEKLAKIFIRHIQHWSATLGKAGRKMLF